MRHLIIIILPLLLSCSPYQQYFHYDYNQVKAQRLQSVIITPIDMIRERPKGADFAKMKELEQAIEDYVGQNGRIVKSNGLLFENWKLEAKKADGFFDPVSGGIDGAKIGACLLKAIGRTKSQQEFDGVIFAQLITRPAKLIGDRVYWDGCSRELLDDDGNALTDIIWRGEMKGLSLQIQVFDGNHQLVFQNMGAVEFPFELRETYSSKEFVWKDTLQFDPEEIREGNAIAFHPFIINPKYPANPIFYEE